MTGSGAGAASRRRSGVGMVLAAALLVVAGAVPADAAITMGSAITRTKDITVPFGEIGSGRVRCPKGYRTLAGGAYWFEPGQQISVETNLFRWLSASIPIKGGTGWYVAGKNGDGVAATLRIVVECLPGTWTFVSVTTWFDVGGSTAGGYVVCPDRHRIVSGGAAWQIPGDPLAPSVAADTTLAGSTATQDGRGWFSNGGRYVESAAKLRVVALCRPNKKVGPYHSVQAFFDPHPTSLVAGGGWIGVHGRTSCGSGRRAVTGGSFWNVPGGGPSTDARLGSSHPTTDRKDWFAAGRSFASTLRLYINLLCRPL